MSDYIKREDALNGCKQWLEPKEQDELDTMWNHGIEACLNEIKHHVPSADVTGVVRCKDCKYAELHKDTGVIFCEINDWGGRWIKADDYCSYGERKDDERE